MPLIQALRASLSLACLRRRITVPPRPFHAAAPRAAKPLPPRLVIPESDLSESFLKGTGPGGQKINKCNSAVQLKHLPTGIVIKCQETRSRAHNREIARRELADRVEALLKGDESRVAKKAREGARKRASRLKKSRRKYRKLAEGKEEEMSGEEGGGEDEGKVKGAGKDKKG